MNAILKRMGMLFGAVFVFALVVNLVLASMGYAQDATQPDKPLWKVVLDVAVLSILPALWAAVGPTVTAFLTKGVNKFANAYVPRPAQVVLSGLITAGLAGLSGDPSGVVQAGIEGVSGQILAATHPSTLLTEAPNG